MATKTQVGISKSIEAYIEALETKGRRGSYILNFEVIKDEVHITYDDQQQINLFARTNDKLRDAKDEIVAKKKQLENYKDAEDEIMMLEGDDEMIPYHIGEAFFLMSPEQASSTLESRQTEIQSEIDELSNLSDAYSATLKDLKVKLYAKFGTSINLEADE